jgi:hypothetical protein
MSYTVSKPRRRAAQAGQVVEDAEALTRSMRRARAQHAVQRLCV